MTYANFTQYHLLLPSSPTRALNLLSGLVVKMLIKHYPPWKSLTCQDQNTKWETDPSDSILLKYWWPGWATNSVRSWAALLANPCSLSDCGGRKQHACSQNFSAKNILGLKIPSNLTDALISLNFQSIPNWAGCSEILLYFLYSSRPKSNSISPSTSYLLLKQIHSQGHPKWADTDLSISNCSPKK